MCTCIYSYLCMYVQRFTFNCQYQKIDLSNTKSFFACHNLIDCNNLSENIKKVVCHICTFCS